MNVEGACLQFAHSIVITNNHSKICLNVVRCQFLSACPQEYL